MTLEITSVQSAEYNADNEIMFTVTCGDITGVVTKIFNTTRDQVNDTTLQAWVDDGNSIAAYVAPAVDPNRWIAERRQDREQEFSVTIDKISPVRYALLTDDEKSSINTWRQEWLDYPSNVNNTRPVRLDTNVF